MSHRNDSSDDDSHAMGFGRAKARGAPAAKKKSVWDTITDSDESGSDSKPVKKTTTTTSSSKKSVWDTISSDDDDDDSVGDVKKKATTTVTKKTNGGNSTTTTTTTTSGSKKSVWDTISSDEDDDDDDDDRGKVSGGFGKASAKKTTTTTTSSSKSGSGSKRSGFDSMTDTDGDDSGSNSSSSAAGFGKKKTTTTSTTSAGGKKTTTTTTTSKTSVVDDDDDDDNDDSDDSLGGFGKPKKPITKSASTSVSSSSSAKPPLGKNVSSSTTTKNGKTVTTITTTTTSAVDYSDEDDDDGLSSSGSSSAGGFGKKKTATKTSSSSALTKSSSSVGASASKSSKKTLTDDDDSDDDDLEDPDFGFGKTKSSTTVGSSGSRKTVTINTTKNKSTALMVTDDDDDSDSDSDSDDEPNTPGGVHDELHLEKLISRIPKKFLVRSGFNPFEYYENERELDTVKASVDAAVEAIVGKSYKGFNQATSSFRSVLHTFTDSQQLVRQLQADVTEGQRILHAHNRHLKSLYREQMKYEAVIHIVHQIQFIKDVPSRLGTYMSRHQYLRSVFLLLHTLRMLSTPELRQVEALFDIREDLLTLKQDMQKLLLDELRDVMFLRDARLRQSALREGDVADIPGKYRFKGSAVDHPYQFEEGFGFYRKHSDTEEQTQAVDRVHSMTFMKQQSVPSLMDAHGPLKPADVYNAHAHTRCVNLINTTSASKGLHSFHAGGRLQGKIEDDHFEDNPAFSPFHSLFELALEADALEKAVQSRAEINRTMRELSSSSATESPSHLLSRARTLSKTSPTTPLMGAKAFKQTVSPNLARQSTFKVEQTTNVFRARYLCRLMGLENVCSYIADPLAHPDVYMTILVECLHLLNHLPSAQQRLSRSLADQVRVLTQRESTALTTQILDLASVSFSHMQSQMSSGSKSDVTGSVTGTNGVLTTIMTWATNEDKKDSTVGLSAVTSYIRQNSDFQAQLVVDLVSVLTRLYSTVLINYRTISAHMSSLMAPLDAFANTDLSFTQFHQALVTHVTAPQQVVDVHVLLKKLAGEIQTQLQMVLWQYWDQRRRMPAIFSFDTPVDTKVAQASIVTRAVIATKDTIATKLSPLAQPVGTAASLVKDVLSIAFKSTTSHGPVAKLSTFGELMPSLDFSFDNSATPSVARQRTALVGATTTLPSMAVGEKILILDEDDDLDLWGDDETNACKVVVEDTQWNNPSPYHVALVYKPLLLFMDLCSAIVDGVPSQTYLPVPPLLTLFPPPSASIPPLPLVTLSHAQSFLKQAAPPIPARNRGATISGKAITVTTGLLKSLGGDDTPEMKSERPVPAPPNQGFQSLLTQPIIAMDASTATLPLRQCLTHAVTHTLLPRLNADILQALDRILNDATAFRAIEYTTPTNAAHHPHSGVRLSAAETQTISTTDLTYRPDVYLQSAYGEGSNHPFHNLSSFIAQQQQRTFHISSPSLNTALPKLPSSGSSDMVLISKCVAELSVLLQALAADMVLLPHAIPDLLLIQAHILHTFIDRVRVRYDEVTSKSEGSVYSAHVMGYPQSMTAMQQDLWFTDLRGLARPVLHSRTAQHSPKGDDAIKPLVPNNASGRMAPPANPLPKTSVSGSSAVDSPSSATPVVVHSTPDTTVDALVEQFFNADSPVFGPMFQADFALHRSQLLYQAIPSQQNNTSPPVKPVSHLALLSSSLDWLANFLYHLKLPLSTADTVSSSTLITLHATPNQTPSVITSSSGYTPIVAIPGAYSSSGVYMAQLDPNVPAPTAITTVPQSGLDIGRTQSLVPVSQTFISQPSSVIFSTNAPQSSGVDSAQTALSLGLSRVGLHSLPLHMLTYSPGIGAGAVARNTAALSGCLSLCRMLPAWRQTRLYLTEEMMVREQKAPHANNVSAAMSDARMMLAQELFKASNMCCFTIKLEVMCRVFFHLKQMQAADYVSSASDDTDSFILELNKELVSIEEVLSRYWDNSRIHYIFGGVSYLMSSLLVANMALLPNLSVSPRGVKTLHRNIFALQQNLVNMLPATHSLTPASSFPQYGHHVSHYHEAHFDHARTYMELLLMSPTDLKNFEQTNPTLFSTAEYATLKEIVANNEKNQTRNAN